MAAEHGKAKAILADEPTASVDATDAPALFRQLIEMAKELRIPLVVITHDKSLAQMADRILLMKDGLLIPVVKGKAKRTAIAPTRKRKKLKRFGRTGRRETVAHQSKLVKKTSNKKQTLNEPNEFKSRDAFFGSGATPAEFEWAQIPAVAKIYVSVEAD